MEKSLLKSKTVWGFGIAGIIMLAQTLGVDVASNTVAQVTEILSGLFGVYGLRDALE
jgi:uncharacterized membrane protein